MLCRCGTVGCGLQFVASGHRHSCSTCRRTGGHWHSHRCDRTQHELWAQLLRPGPSAPTSHPGSTAGCGRSASYGHRTCCSRCGLSGGHIHSARCHRQVSAWSVQRPTPLAHLQHGDSMRSEPSGPVQVQPPATSTSAEQLISSVAMPGQETLSVISSEPTDGSGEHPSGEVEIEAPHSGMHHYEPLDLDELD